MTPLHFSPHMRLAELISANHNLILILPRLGISLGFGDRSVREVCVQYDVPEDFFLLLCNVYSFEDYRPGHKEIEHTDMHLLAHYLRKSHQDYLERLKHIERHLQQLAGQVEPKYGQLLTGFYEDYQQEVIEHFDCEEKIVFPYMQQLEDGGTMPEGTEGFSIARFKHVHGNVHDKLNDLTGIIFKYLPGNVFPKESIELIFDIFQISIDLDRHTLVENKVLVPYVEHLERIRK